MKCHIQFTNFSLDRQKNAQNSSLIQKMKIPFLWKKAFKPRNLNILNYPVQGPNCTESLANLNSRTALPQAPYSQKNTVEKQGNCGKKNY